MRLPLCLIAGAACVLSAGAGSLGGQGAASPAPSRADSVSAPVRDVRYDVTFTRATAESRMVDVAMTFTVDGPAPVLLSLPDWTPGDYEMSWFSRWVVDFAATAAGRALPWDKVDYDTWRVRPSGAGTVRVAFRYLADSLDNAMAWSRPDFLLFNGTNLFLHPTGQPLNFASVVTVHTEPEWHVATGMTRAPGTNTFSADNYHDLVDMPFFVGRYDLDSTRILDRWVRLATYPAGALAGDRRADAWRELAHVMPPEAAVFGDTPWPNYTVMMIVDSAYDGASGLEHQSSQVDVLSPQYLGSDFQPSLFAHETFHSWNVKRLRPADLWPYVYSRPQPTPWLWVSEGITDYYADLAEVRGGVVGDSGFYALTSAKINEVANTAPVALRDASLDTWVHPVDGTEYLYYSKGSLAGFALDLMIRSASDDARSLDDVMRNLYQAEYKHGRGFTGAEWWQAVRAAAGGAPRPFDEFAARYVDGRAPFPWDSLLALAGLRLRQTRVPRLGVLTQPGPDGVVVASVEPGSSAADAGVRPGDVLVSIGGISVDDEQFGAKLRAKYEASSEGEPLPIAVRRNGADAALAGRLRFGPGDAVIEADPGASAKAIRIRDGILKGRTEP